MPPAAFTFCARTTTLALVAFFVAQGTNALVARACLRSSDSLLEVPPGADRRTRSPHAVPLGLFDDDTRPARPPVSPTVRCDERRRLVGTVVGAHGRAALIEPDGRSRTVRLGEHVGEQTVASIARDAVVLTGAAGECHLGFSGAPADRGRIPTASSGHEQVISRERIRALAEDPALLGSVRVVALDGRLALYGIRRASPFAELGLRNGDRLLAIDDRPIAGLEDALALYAELQTATDVRVAIERRGEPLELHFRVE